MFSGSGPGTQTADGSSVELYRRLHEARDLDGVVARLAPGMTLLELGCGTGRHTRQLLAAGCKVTAVDNSAEMLVHVPVGAKPVQADIQSLALGQRFDAVLLASGLINHPDASVRTAFVETAARHLAPAGDFIVQRQDPRWLADVHTGWASRSGDFGVCAESVRRTAETIEITLAYRLGEDRWRQSFAVVALDDRALQSLLMDGGFTTVTWLDERWAVARH